MCSSLSVESRDPRSLAVACIDRILTLEYPLPRVFFLLKSQFDLGVEIPKTVHGDLLSLNFAIVFKFTNQLSTNPVAAIAEVSVIEKSAEGSKCIQMLELAFEYDRAEKKILIEKVTGMSSYHLVISIFDAGGRRMVKREYVV
jgi:hypothetical protein